MVSILIPIYNGIEFISDSVESVINQTSNSWELLIGINGHEKCSNVWQIAKKYEEKHPNIKVLDFYFLKGKAKTLNELIKHTFYDYMAILDVEDIWHEQKLASQIVYLPLYDVVGTRCIYFGEKELVLDIPIGDITGHDFLKNNPIINSSAIIKKELCCWNEMVEGVEDYDLWLLLRIRQHKKFYNCDGIFVKHRIHANSAFNSKGNDELISDLRQKYRD